MFSLLLLYFPAAFPAVLHNIIVLMCIHCGHKLMTALAVAQINIILNTTSKEMIEINGL
jgi:hypothetical protein